MATSLIRGKYLVARGGAESSTVITDGALFQRDGLIEDVGPYDELKARHAADEEIGGQKYVVLPGLVNAHHHGRGISSFQLGTLEDSLETYILANWGRPPIDSYVMSLYSNLRLIETGVTTVMYNHVLAPTAGLEEDLQKVLKAFSDSGVRTGFSVWFRDQNRLVYDDDEKFLANLPTDMAASVRKYLAAYDMSADDYFSLFERIYREYGADPSSKVRVLLSPANVQWCSDDFLQRTKEYATRYKTGVHIHMVESVYQKEYGTRTWGKTPVDHLNDLGFLGPELSCAHAVWLTDHDIDLLAETSTTICHNASSNLRLKNGVAPVSAMVARGVNVAVGTDSIALNDDDDMLQEMRLVSKLHRDSRIGGPSVNSHQILHMSTLGGAVPTFFSDQVGALERGRRADVVLLDLDSIQEPYLDPDTNPVDAMVYRGKASHVDTVIIDGEVILRDGRFTKINKEEIVAQLKEHLSHPMSPSGLEARQLGQRLMPYVERFFHGWEGEGGSPHYRYNSRT